MAMTFEGVEKRLELIFPQETLLREDLARKDWEKILKPVNCEIELDMCNNMVDSYLLSASSLFVFDDRIVLKTCGDTKVFESINGILRNAKEKPIAVKYTRGAYFWPEKQPKAYKDINLEIANLYEFLPFYKKMISQFGTDEKFKFYFVGGHEKTVSVVLTNGVTVEMLMMGLDRVKAAVFFKKNGGGRMTSVSGIDHIIPGSKISDFEFDGCGYSMNGIGGDNSVYTIHVTPEEEFSFASFESYNRGFTSNIELNCLLKRVLACFNPTSFIVTLHSTSTESFELDLDRSCKHKDVQDLGNFGTLVYFHF